MKVTQRILFNIFTRIACVNKFHVPNYVEVFCIIISYNFIIITIDSILVRSGGYIFCRLWRFMLHPVFLNKHDCFFTDLFYITTALPTIIVNAPIVLYSFMQSQQFFNVSIQSLDSIQGQKNKYFPTLLCSYNSSVTFTTCFTCINILYYIFGCKPFSFYTINLTQCYILLLPEDDLKL